MNRDPDAATTRQQRSHQRNRRALLTSAANVAAKVVTVATSFATVPMTLHYLGAERFGLWMTISSLSALLAFADFGLGNGLLNAVAHANGREDAPAMRRAIASALAMLGGLALLLLGMMCAVVKWVDLSTTFGLADTAAIAELKPALVVFCLCFALSLLMGVVQRTLIGLQLGFLNGMTGAAGSLLGLALVLLTIWQSAGLPWLVAGLLGGPIVATLASGAWLFAIHRPDLRPRWAAVERPAMLHLAHLGGLFFVLQVATAVAFSSDNMIGSRFAGAGAVGEFSVAAKLFAAVGMVASIYLGPLWPAYGEAIARGDVAWARRTLLRSTVFASVLAALASVALVAAFGTLTRLWLGAASPVSMTLLWGLGAWTTVCAAGTGVAMFLNGAHVVKEQVVIALVFAGVCVVGKVLATRHFGMAALPWVATIAYVALVLVPYAALLPGILRRLPLAPRRLPVDGTVA